MEKVILNRKEKAVSFDESDDTIHFHKTYYTIVEAEEALKQAKEIINIKACSTNSCRMTKGE